MVLSDAEGKSISKLEEQQAREQRTQLKKQKWDAAAVKIWKMIFLSLDEYENKPETAQRAAYKSAAKTFVKKQAKLYQVCDVLRELCCFCPSLLTAMSVVCRGGLANLVLLLVQVLRVLQLLRLRLRVKSRKKSKSKRRKQTLAQREREPGNGRQLRTTRTKRMTWCHVSTTTRRRSTTTRRRTKIWQGSSVERRRTELLLNDLIKNTHLVNSLTVRDIIKLIPFPAGKDPSATRTAPH
jgi:hypothetical protein